MRVRLRVQPERVLQQRWCVGARLPDPRPDQQSQAEGAEGRGSGARHLPTCLSVPVPVLLQRQSWAGRPMRTRLAAGRQRVPLGAC